MKITHLYHSGTLIELEKYQLLFDYYQGNLQLNHDKPLYVFVSHNHYDHYNKQIFQLKLPNIHYILSNDIHTHHKAMYVKPHQTYQLDDIDIKTLLSTDQGVAYIVEVEDKVIYFAGDLHWWHWEGEPDIDNEWQRRIYQQEICKMPKEVDLACIVVDKRLDNNYLLGLQYFMQHINSRYILPIHYFGDYSISNILEKEKLDNPYHTQILYPTHKNQTFKI